MSDVLSAAQVQEMLVFPETAAVPLLVSDFAALARSHEQLRGERDAAVYKLARGWDAVVKADKARAIKAEIRAEDAEAEVEQLRGERDDAQAMYRHERKFQLGQADELAAAVRAGGEAAAALRAVDAFLTTVEGDNVPRGEACKMQARAIAREALESLSPAGEQP